MIYTKFHWDSPIIGLSGKFVPILKENWNAEDLNFSIVYTFIKFKSFAARTFRFNFWSRWSTVSIFCITFKYKLE